MSKLLFAVHRYWPDEGGSERNVKHMAEEMVRRGHDVSVLTQGEPGVRNGVTVVNETNVLLKIWDLIIVHGSCPVQDVVLFNSDSIVSPILYLIIQPTDSDISQRGMKYCDFIGYGTSFDLAHIEKYGHGSKARKVDYGIPGDYEYAFESDDAENKFRALLRVKPDAKMILSIGGWWPHKKMEELIDVYKAANLENAHLVLCGYDTKFGAIPQNTENRDDISLITNATHEQVMAMMATADLYVMNSESEGFGLVLLEAMINHTPWLARDIAGAHDMKSYGTVYSTREELFSLLKMEHTAVHEPYRYIQEHRRVEHMGNDLDKILAEAGYDRASESELNR